MTAIVLGVALLAVLGVLYVREREHDRKERELMDRIQAPEAASVAAFSRSIVPSSPPVDLDAQDDLKFGRDITHDLDTDWIPLGLDS